MLVIVSCGAEKQQGEHKAETLYTSDFFKKKLEYARTLTSDTSIRILSGKHGFIPLDSRIRHYDQKIGKPGGVTMATLESQANDLEKLADQGIVFLGGQDYVRIVREIWSDCFAPLSGGIGVQKKWLAEKIFSAKNSDLRSVK